MHATERRTTRVLANEPVSDTGRILRLERRGLEFRAGELVALHGEGPLDQRDYTVASGTGDELLEILYRLVPHGTLTPQLATWAPGREVELTGPYGRFTVCDPERPLVFIATGTGIAPARSYLRSHPGLDLTVLHGVREEADLFYRKEFEVSGTGYLPCVSGVQGRVTERLPGLVLPENAHFYICGANEMIYEVQDQLRERGIAEDRVFTEPYYYRLDT